MSAKDFAIRARVALCDKWDQLKLLNQTEMLGLLAGAYTAAEKIEAHTTPAGPQPKRDRNGIPPTHAEVAAYLRDELKSDLDPQDFLDFYTSKGWLVGKMPMKDWRSAANRAHRLWDRPGRNRHGAAPAAPAPLTEWERKQKTERRTGLCADVRALLYPGGSAYPVYLAGEKLKQATALREKIAALDAELA